MKIAVLFLLLMVQSFTPALAATQTGADNSLIAYDNNTIIDTKSGLMWGKADNGKDFSWVDAVIFAESYSLASYDDWRLPTKEELSSLFREEVNSDGLKISQLFKVESIFLYASETKACKAAFANITNSSFNWVLQSRPDFGRVLLVRNQKNSRTDQ